MAAEIDLSVIVPLYQEGPTLRDSLVRLAAALAAGTRRWEIVFVDDGSRDGSRQVAEHWAVEHRQGDPTAEIRSAHHARNRGRGAAVKTGLLAARGTVAGFLDIDLEVGEQFIDPCVAAVEAGADVVVGEREYALQPRSWLRHLLSKGYASLCRSVIHTSVRDTEAGFKWFRREALLPLLDHIEDDGWFFDTEVVVRAERAGLTVISVPVEFVRRFEKTSTVRPLRDSLVYLRRLFAFRRALGRAA